MKYEQMPPEEKIKVLEMLSQCKHLSVARAICDQYDIPYTMIPQRMKPIMSINEFIKNKDFHMQFASDIYCSYVQFCIDNCYNIETQNLLTRTIKNAMGYCSIVRSLNGKNGTILIDPKQPIDEFDYHVEDFLNSKYKTFIDQMSASGVYQTYCSFCNEIHYTPTNNIQFGREMRKYGYTTYQRKIQGITRNFYVKKENT